MILFLQSRRLQQAGQLRGGRAGLRARHRHRPRLQQSLRQDGVRAAPNSQIPKFPRGFWVPEHPRTEIWSLCSTREKFPAVSARKFLIFIFYEFGEDKIWIKQGTKIPQCLWFLFSFLVEFWVPEHLRASIWSLCSTRKNFLQFQQENFIFFNFCEVGEDNWILKVTKNPLSDFNFYFLSSWNFESLKFSYFSIFRKLVWTEIEF